MRKPRKEVSFTGGRLLPRPGVIPAVKSAGGSGSDLSDWERSCSPAAAAVAAQYGELIAN